MSNAFAPDKLNNWAGGFFLAGNTCVLFRGVLDEYFETHVIDFAQLAENPASAAAGACFVPAAALMLAAGHKNLITTVAMGLNTVGNTILISGMIADSEPGAAITGVGFGLVGAAYAFRKGILSELRKNKEQISQPEAGEMFSETKRDITSKYPFLPTAILNLASSALVGFGALQAEDGALGSIVALWTIGSLFLSRAIPKVHKNQPLYEPA